MKSSSDLLGIRTQSPPLCTPETMWLKYFCEAANILNSGVTNCHKPHCSWWQPFRVDHTHIQKRYYSLHNFSNPQVWRNNLFIMDSAQTISFQHLDTDFSAFTRNEIIWRSWIKRTNLFLFHVSFSLKHQQNDADLWVPVFSQ